MGLSERDRAILDLERTWWTEPGSKQDAIRSRLGLSPTRYYQVLDGLLDTSDAEGYDPLVVKRLRRLRGLRRRARFQGRPAGGRQQR
ncbi:MAG: DUF3263 domain-containing protein [Acidimicrobiales bacterium]